MKRQLTEEENKTNESNTLAIDTVRDLAKGILREAHSLAAGSDVPWSASTEDIIKAGRLADLGERACKVLSELQSAVFISAIIK